MSAPLTALIGAMLLGGPARAGRVDAGGYLRVGVRPDLQGGIGALGYWNLYGRLLNEGPYAALDVRFAVLERRPGEPAPWAAVHFKVEGGSILGADAQNGSLDAFRLSRAYVEAGGMLLPRVTWQVGTLDTWMGDLGLYDMRPASLFWGTVGASGRWEGDWGELLLGAGDSGWSIRADAYDPVLTGGGWLRLRAAGGHLELGGGGEYRYEPRVPGNTHAPYATPGLDYEQWLRGEFVETWLAEHPGRELDFPDPVPVDARSWKLVGYAGFGGLGPVVWNNLFLSWERHHPEGPTTETVDGQTWTLYVTELTDERTSLRVGDEVQLRVLPERLDVVWAALYGNDEDRDNDGVAPTDWDRAFASTVLRAQVYLSPTVHWLTESSVAWEHSKNGNAYREHRDSIFAGEDGRADARGLEYGDSDTRRTWQGKAGFVLNPLGPGVFVRPSLRLLYGVQYSTQNGAFGSGFVDTLDQYADFVSVERHWHHVVAIETEAWF